MSINKASNRGMSNRYLSNGIRVYDVQTLTILNGQSISLGLDMQGWQLAAIQAPPDWTTAGLTLLASADGTNYAVVLQGAGSTGNLSFTLTSSTMAIKSYYWSMADMSGTNETFSPRYLQLLSGTNAVPVLQQANRDFKVVRYRDVSRIFDVQFVTIPAGATVSNGLDMRGWELQGIQSPSVWTAAPVMFQGSANGTDFVHFTRGSGGPILNITMSTFPNYYPISDAGGTYGGTNPPFFRIASGTKLTPVSQQGDRVFMVIRHRCLPPMNYDVQTLTIASGNTVSNGLDMQGWKLQGFITPSAWTTAIMSPQKSADGVYYHGFINEQISSANMTSNAPAYHTIYDLGGSQGTVNPRYLRFESGTDLIPVIQASDREFQVVRYRDLCETLGVG